MEARCQGRCMGVWNGTIRLSGWYGAYESSMAVIESDEYSSILSQEGG